MMIDMGSAVLLVDDDPSVLAMLRAVLESEGFSVTAATGAGEARRKLLTGAFDVVVTDMRMETAISGFDVVRFARAQPQAPAIILLSAYSISEKDWRDSGAHAAFEKPVPIQDFVSTIRSLLLERTTQR
jgi:CheY-like chemotaxis protein